MKRLKDRVLSRVHEAQGSVLLIVLVVIVVLVLVGFGFGSCGGHGR